jgi:hypothetical protein
MRKTAWNKRYEISYESILRQAREAYNNAMSWRSLAPDNVEVQQTAVRYLTAAETLVELLEAYNCGQHGGFDSYKGINQAENVKYHGSLRKRLRWLEEVRR